MSAELLHHSQEIAFGLSLALPVLMSFTKRQREWILRRDDYEPQLRGYSEERGFYNAREDYCKDPENPCTHLEVNHIVNQADGGTDDPFNGITVGKCQHVGYCPSGRIRDEIAKKGSHGKRTK